MTGAINPLWNAIKGLPIEQQDALLRQHAPGAANVQEAQQAPAQPMATGQAKGMAQPMPQEMPQGAGPGSEPSQGTPQPNPAVAKAPNPGLAANPELQRAQAEQHRLLTSPSGIDQIKSPWARIPLQILDAVGQGFAPGLRSGHSPAFWGHPQRTWSVAQWLT